MRENTRCRLGSFPGCGDASGLELPALSARTAQQVCDRLTSQDFGAWSEAVARVGNCAHPIRLAGSSDAIDRATGEIISTYSSADE